MSTLDDFKPGDLVRVPLRLDEIQHVAPLTRDDIDALPVGAVIKDSDGDTYERTTDTRWTRTSAMGDVEQHDWHHEIVVTLSDSYAPVTLISSPTAEPGQPAAPTIADTLRAQADALDAEAREARKEHGDLMDRAWALADKADKTAYLAAQYRTVASDLEARG